MAVFTVWIYFFFFKQKTAYEMRISDWSSDVCSSDLHQALQERLLNLDVGHAVELHGVGGQAEEATLERDALVGDPHAHGQRFEPIDQRHHPEREIGRASCRERVSQSV